jgi:hypothetical protein
MFDFVCQALGLGQMSGVLVGRDPIRPSDYAAHVLVSGI